jgi:hypothetical protein
MHAPAGQEPLASSPALWMMASRRGGSCAIFDVTAIIRYVFDQNE